MDSGCGKSIVPRRLVGLARGGPRNVITVDGSRVRCSGTVTVTVEVDGARVTLECLVMDNLLKGVDVVLGVDFIGRIGGVSLTSSGVEFAHRPHGRVTMAAAAAAAPTKTSTLNIEDRDFQATFDGRRWTVKWKWKEEPPVLRNKVPSYAGVDRPEIKEEISEWIRKGWLQEESERVDGGFLPLMAVVQPNKKKIRPVLDFRELNEFVESRPGVDATVCDETLRRWRRMPGPTKLVDLRSAYLQLHVDESLWKYQRVKWEEKIYRLTRLGFGLNCAPRIMTKILQFVLAQDEKIDAATSSYIDDILVDESVVAADVVVAHLRKYGLEAKPPQNLAGGSVLGLRVTDDGRGCLTFRRGNQLPELQDGTLSRRQLFSICGQLVGHYPLAGWLRVACSYMKRAAGTGSWSDKVPEHALRMLNETIERVKKEDPVCGQWTVADVSRGRVWCDASALAIGASVEIGGKAVEDAAWLRKPTDSGHINVAELEAVLKGVNLALKWALKNVEIVTDSATVFGWIRSICGEGGKAKVSGLSEMLIKRRLGLLTDLMQECDLTLSIVLVASEKNRADVLTRVPKSWTQLQTQPACAIAAEKIAQLHKEHHFGVDRSLYLTRMVAPEAQRDEVEACVRACVKCKTIDPQPTRHDEGSLGVSEDWMRLALDGAHYDGQAYLVLIDCGPSRFAIWRKIRSENAEDIAVILDQVFKERGPPAEMLTDNGTAFRSNRVAETCSRWGVRQLFRAAHRPQGNGIAERNIRTIKRTAARSGISPSRAAFWYNLAPRDRKDAKTAPAAMLHTYDWRHPMSATEPHEQEPAEYVTGDVVFVKPPAARCTDTWPIGRVTAVNSRNNVDVDGIPRHVLDVRPAGGTEAAIDVQRQCSALRYLGALPNNSEVISEQREVEVVRPTRERKPPSWSVDYVM